MNVKHVHENAELQPGLRPHLELRRRNGMDDGQQLAICGTDDQTRPVGRGAFGIAKERYAPECEGRKCESGPRGKLKQQKIGCEEQRNVAPTVAMNGNSQRSLDPASASVGSVPLRKATD